MESFPPGSSLLKVDKPAFIPVAVVSGIGMVLTCIFFAVNIKYRGYKLLKMTSPNLNLVMLSGAIVLFASIVLFGATAWLSEYPTQEELNLNWKFNQAGVWLASVGFTLFFSPLAAKTWRVHRIFTDAAVKGRVIKDEKLLCIVALLVVFDLGYLAMWFGVDPPVCHLVPSSQIPGFLAFIQPSSDVSTLTESTSAPVTSSITLEYVTTCTSKFTPLWVIIMTSYKAALLYYIIYVAWSTRYVTLPSMKDAGGLIISAFVTLTSFCVATPFVTSLHRWPSAQYIVTSCAIFVPVYTVIFLHFVPKLILIRRHDKDEILTRSFSQYTTPNKPEFTEDEIQDLAIQNASLRKEVAEKQRRYKTVLEQLRVAKAKLFEYSVLTSDSCELLPPTTDDVTTRSVDTESSPIASTECDSLKPGNGHLTRKEMKIAKKKLKKSGKNNSNENNVEEVMPSITSESPTISKADDVTIDMASSNTTQSSENEISIAENENGDPAVSLKEVIAHHEVASSLRNKCTSEATVTHQRHVSFTDMPQRKEYSDKRLTNANTYQSQSALYNMSNGHRGGLLPLGKNSWDYYTRGTGYLKYKATVLNHGVNGTIAAITGYPVTDTNPNRIIARRTVINEEVIESKLLVPGHSTPIVTEVSGNEDDCAEGKDPNVKKSKEFRYYSTSASSRSPSTSTDMTSSVVGHSNDETTTSNNNIHPIDENGTQCTKKKKSSSNDTDVPSPNSAFSVVSSKGKRPCSGSNDVKVTSSHKPRNQGNAGYIYEQYSSDSDSDDYDDTTTSMDSITCELFPPMTPRQKHYLRRYDAMHAKYLAQLEKGRKRQHKTLHSEKSEGYSSGHDDTTKNGASARVDDVITRIDTSSKQVKSSTKNLGQYPRKEMRRKIIGRTSVRSDDRFLYDSITSTDSDSDSDWGNSATLQRCWQKVAQHGSLPLLHAGPITYSHTHRDGIFV